MAETKLSEALQKQIDDLAREQHRDASAVLEDAVSRYAAAHRLERFVDKMGERAQRKGIRESEIPRLVDEVRRENSGRVR